ncbi:MAG: hypothetical protein JW984_03380 [Deltaproteobacteria bacterium]|uniref:DUF2141 domain-containing protein n=1 Tax=Candidatus Zymogenus saltonus TaxID=2844893 RepID=A0A9D8PNL9_9DELT|nr:hypothetical protein [Candidatus Zymogenus saltonus]
MKLKKILLLLFILSIALVTAVNAYAQRTASQTHTFALEKWITINLSVEGISVKELRFFNDTKTTGGTFGINPTSGPYMNFVVYNDAYHEVDYGIAVALFDKKNNLITAESYTHPGEIDAGERHEGTIIFGPVNRRYHEASYFKIALEIY